MNSSVFVAVNNGEAQTTIQVKQLWKDDNGIEHVNGNGLLLNMDTFSSLMSQLRSIESSCINNAMFPTTILTEPTQQVANLEIAIQTFKIRRNNVGKLRKKNKIFGTFS